MTATQESAVYDLIEMMATEAEKLSPEAREAATVRGAGDQCLSPDELIAAMQRQKDGLAETNDRDLIFPLYVRLQHWHSVTALPLGILRDIAAVECPTSGSTIAAIIFLISVWETRASK